ncbi:MAG TPA: hypothetical protein VLM89_08465 [Phycisphaerae bacterium]|nr:hypothetical protein [Phycisphaerae bacterium]
MMRATNLILIAGMLTVGADWLAGVRVSQADPGDRRPNADRAMTRPAQDSGGWDRPGTQPAGPRRPWGAPPRGWGRDRPEYPMRRGPGMPPPGQMNGMGPGARRGGEGEAPLTPEEREELIGFVQKHFPEMYHRLKRFQATDPVLYGRAMRRLAMPMFRMMQIGRHDPELAETMIAEHKIEMALADLAARNTPQASQADRDRISLEVRDLLARRFDLRQRRLEMEIKAMQQRLDQALARLSQQAADKSRLVEAEVRRMMGAWEDQRSGRPPLPPRADDTHAFPEAGPPDEK